MRVWTSRWTTQMHQIMKLSPIREPIYTPGSGLQFSSCWALDTFFEPCDSPQLSLTLDLTCWAIKGGVSATQVQRSLDFRPDMLSNLGSNLGRCVSYSSAKESLHWLRIHSSHPISLDSAQNHGGQLQQAFLPFPTNLFFLCHHQPPKLIPNHLFSCHTLDMRKFLE